MSDQLVSIITANHNGEKYIVKTIESVINQTYSNWELFIIDDASLDEGVELIRNYVNKDSRIKLIQNEVNLGAARSRNRGIEQAKGKYIAFLDGDDLWVENKLEKQIEFMEHHSFDFSFTFYKRIDEGGNLISDIISTKSILSYRDLLVENKIGCLTAVYNQESLGKVHMPDLRKRQDYAMWLKLLKKTNAYALEEPLAYYRVRSGSVSSNKIEMLKWNFLMFYKIENFGPLRSSYYVLRNIITKLKKG